MKFFANFCSWIESPYAPDKQAKMVLLKDSLLEIFKFLDPLKKLTKNVGLCWNSSHTGIFDYKFNIIYQGKDKSDASKTRCSVSLHGVWLRAVLATFGFSKKINSLTPQSVSLRRAWLRTVLVNFGFLKIFENISKNLHLDPRFPEMEMFKSQHKLFDSVLC